MLAAERHMLQDIAQKLAGYPAVIKGIAYGSRIRGDNRGESDLDVLIIIQEKNRSLKEAIRELFYTYELEKGVSFSVAILSYEEFLVNEQMGSPFLDTVKEEGVVFYDLKSTGKENTGRLST